MLSFVLGIQKLLEAKEAKVSSGTFGPGLGCGCIFAGDHDGGLRVATRSASGHRGVESWVSHSADKFRIEIIEHNSTTLRAQHCGTVQSPFYLLSNTKYETSPLKS